jgi:hypothetical protein
MIAVVFAATVSASCFDPVHSDDVAALGGEKAGVREGPTHRPGQPCLVCHGGSGPGSPEFEIAGTIYESSLDPSAPAEGVEIVVTDVTGKVIPLPASNRAGNFYLEKDRQTLYYPLTIELRSPLITDQPAGSKVMVSPIGRNGGCAFCHVDNILPQDRATHMPHVYLNRQ